MSKERLSVAQAHEYVHLYNILEQHRTYVLDYMLLRSSNSANPAERRAWMILVGLLVFVETKHHFPYQEEMDIYLRNFLGSKPLDLPPLTELDLIELRSLASQLKTSLDTYVQK